MKEIQYKTFSWRTHKKNWRIKRPNVCQFELTFKCDLYCRHCYSDCYNKPSYIKKEVTTNEAKLILDKIHQAGVIWLCFTGGDPLTRPDFLELYSYAKDKGFLITIFTNAYSMTEEIADYLKRNPPFVIEITLNAVTKETYEKISQVEDSYERAMDGLKIITNRRLPLKIKTQVTKDNSEELPRVRRFIEDLGKKFQLSPILYARLNGDLTPCSLRILPQEVLRLDRRHGLDSMEEDEQLSAVCQLSKNETQISNIENREPNTELFHCAISTGDGVHIDPYGNIIPCNCIRESKINLLEENIEEARKIVLEWVRSITFTINSKCKNCSIRNICHNCPGKALLEKGTLEGAIDWFCELAHLTKRRSTV